MEVNVEMKKFLKNLWNEILIALKIKPRIITTVTSNQH